MEYLKLNIVLGFYIWRQHNKAIKAFTLAEVLITLTIIGVVAALTIPAVIQSTQNAELQATVDNGGGFGPLIETSTTTAYTKFNALKSKLNVVKVCPYNSNALGNCWTVSGVGKGLSNDCSRFTVSAQDVGYSLVTSDGMYWMLYSYSATNGIPWVAVDVNGSKGPNDWGKDVFAFEIDDTSLKPMTYNCSWFLKHNDNSTVDPATEFTAPFKR